jgi:hypothetical protein
VGPGAPAPVPGSGCLPRPLITAGEPNRGPRLARVGPIHEASSTRKAETMTEPTGFWLRRLASPRRPKMASRGGRWAVALLLRLGCIVLLAWIGYIHLHLWLGGYRQIPTNGPLFLLDAVAGVGLAAVLLLWPRPLAGLLAVGYSVSTLGALIISLSVGLFGFRESISASFVVESLIIESITVLALISWTVLVAATSRPSADRSPTTQPSPSGRPSRAGSR